MANRVVIGELPSGDYGIKISRRGQNVLTATGKDLLFDSTANSGQGRYLRKFASATSAAGFNNYVPTNDGTQDTENASGQEYHPLFLYIQDGTGITYDTNNQTYFSFASNQVLDSNGTQTTTDDFTQTNGTPVGRIQERLDMLAFNSKADTNLGNPAPINGTRHAAFPVTFTGNAADHGVNLRYWHATQTNNLEWSSNTLGGYGKRLEFRIATGQSLNSRFIYGLSSTSGWYYTVDRTRMGGNPPTNVKIATFRVPCGYGYMTSTYMGF